MTPSQLALLLPQAPVAWLEEVCRQAPLWDINTPLRESHYIGQVGHECAQFTRLVENLNYSDPLRIVKIFRKPFDLDRDGVVDPDEIEMAKGFIRNPVRLANFAYANRFGNGPPESGDGWKYRGRGPIQISFRDNYRDYGLAMNRDVLKDPDLLLQPQLGVESSMWFWAKHGCNRLADMNLPAKITRIINGGDNGLEDRIAMTNKIMGVLV